MNTYIVPRHDEETHRVIQDVPGTGWRSAVYDYGSVACASCDQYIANEGETLQVGHRCKCGSTVVGFVPIRDLPPVPQDVTHLRQSDIIYTNASHKFLYITVTAENIRAWVNGIEIGNLDRYPVVNLRIPVGGSYRLTFSKLHKWEHSTEGWLFK